MIFTLARFHKTKKWFYLLWVLAFGGCATQQPLSLIPFDDGEFWVLGNDLVFTVRQTGQRIVVPRGFVTDFASVPRVFWTFFPKHGEYTRAAIVHDFLYWQQKCSREQADELFDIVMVASEVDSTSRFSIYAAVRVWGGSAWDDNAHVRQQGYVRIIPEHYMNFPNKTRWSHYREYLRQMLDDSDRAEQYPNSDPPSYCRALQEKGPAPEEELKANDEPVEDAPAPQPEKEFIPESAIGA